MDRRQFKSKLFRKIIKIDDPNYWDYLYADILYRIKLNEDLNCTCGSCMAEKHNYKNLLQRLEDDRHVSRHPKAHNFTGHGDCGRRLGPRA